MVKMRGLTMYITEIRNCKSKEEETKRINKELANIRSKFRSEFNISGYDKKKYISKLIFTFFLGHKFDFGHVEAVNLLTSNKYSEKRTGYLFISVVMDEKSNLMPLVYNAVENDLASTNLNGQVLALNFVANLANEELAGKVADKILSLAFTASVPESIKQSAILCLLRIFRLNQDLIPKQYIDRMATFLADQSFGVNTAAASLIEDLAEAKKVHALSVVQQTVFKLNKLVKSPYMEVPEYMYYHITAPWLTVKLLRILNFFPSVFTDRILKERLKEIIEAIFNKVQELPRSKRNDHHNCRNAILFEAVKLVPYFECEFSFIQYKACGVLDFLLKQCDSNTRYTALESLRFLTESPTCKDRIKKDLRTIITVLRTDKDTCIQQKALDLLYFLTDSDNVKIVIEQMLEYLETGEFTIREPLVLRISVLAETYAQDKNWYVDVIIKLLRDAGDFADDDIWHRFVQIVSNDDQVRGYAAKVVFEAMQTPMVHEILVNLAGYILGEYGNLIAGDPRSSPEKQLKTIHSHFKFCSKNTKASLLTTYVKFVNLFPEIKGPVVQIFRLNAMDSDAEVQQRATEYLNLINTVDKNALAAILDEMPRFENKSSLVDKVLEKLNLDTPRKTPKRPLNSDLSKSSSASIVNLRTASKMKCSSLVDVRSGAAEYETLGNMLSIMKTVPENTSVSVPNDEALRFLIWNEFGTLFENKFLLIRTVTTYQKNKGIICLKYRNTTTYRICKFFPHIPNGSSNERLKCTMTSCPCIISPGEEIRQDIKVDCHQEFRSAVLLSLNFLCNGVQQNFAIELPLTLNKFIEPFFMKSDEFFAKWGTMKNNQECVQAFPAKYSMDKQLIVSKLIGLGMKILENIDDNPNNFVCAGIFNALHVRVGILLRLQCNFQSLQYHSSVRSINAPVSEEFSKIIKMIL